MKTAEKTVFGASMEPRRYRRGNVPPKRCASEIKVCKLQWSHDVIAVETLAVDEYAARGFVELQWSHDVIAVETNTQRNEYEKSIN